MQFKNSYLQYIDLNFHYDVLTEKVEGEVLRQPVPKGTKSQGRLLEENQIMTSLN